MSRYDGLIIPRSYNEYINKSDPLTLAQALQQNNVLSGAVAAGDNKAVKSAAVATALTKYGKIYKALDTLNADKGTSIELVSGTDNCSKIVEVLNANEVFNDYFNNSPVNSKWGLPTPSEVSYVLIRFEKLDNNYCIVSAYETDTNTEYFRVSKAGTLGAWQINAKQTELTALSELQLAQFSDCNNIKPSAKQRVIFAETTYLAANIPTGSNYWAIKAFTLSNVPAYVTQIAVSVDGTLRKTRFYNGSTWSSWA